MSAELFADVKALEKEAEAAAVHCAEMVDARKECEQAWYLAKQAVEDARQALDNAKQALDNTKQALDNATQALEAKQALHKTAYSEALEKITTYSRAVDFYNSLKADGVEAARIRRNADACLQWIADWRKKEEKEL